MSIAVDSFGSHNPRSVAASADAGSVACLRYGYNTAVAEVQVIHFGGQGFALIAEFDTATWHPPLHNPEMGAQHANTAVRWARGLGYPPGAVIWLTADTFISPSQFSRAAGYWALAAPILRAAGYLVGAYGGSLFIDYLMSQGVADATWEAGARSWSSATGNPNFYQASRTACLRQTVQQPSYGGVTVDVNTVLGSFGAWMPYETPPIPAPIPQRWMMKALQVTGEDALWRLTDDGNGVLRRQHINNPARNTILAKAEMINGDVVVLTDPDEIAEFRAILESSPYPNDLSMLGVGIQTVNAVNAHTDQAVASVPGGGSPVDVQLIADTTANTVAARLANG